MRLPAPRVLALLAALCAGLAYVTPSAAFDSASFAREATVTVVSSSSAYNAISGSNVCDAALFTNTQCTVGLLTNKATVGQRYRVMQWSDPDDKVIDWSLGGVTAVSSTSSPWTAWTSEKAVGDSVALIVNVTSCVCSGESFTAYLAVEGQKADTLDFNETRIMILIEY